MIYVPSLWLDCKIHWDIIESLSNIGIHMIDQMNKLVKEGKFCVLATASDNNPHCSLMAYAPGEDCRRIYMATRRSTVKYRNLTKNPAVSLLIDTRGDKQKEAGVQGTMALTVGGVFAEVMDEAGRRKAREMLILRHPDLGVFLDHPETCVFAIEIRSFLLLDGLTDSYYEEIWK